jgi:uncharacterized protein
VGKVLREQLEANSANAAVLDNAMKTLASLEAGKAVDAAHIEPSLLPLFGPSIQRFLISELVLDPAALLTNYAKSARPVLIMQGLRDLQVSVEDAQRLKQADPHAELVLLPEANHVLKAIHTSDMNENFAAYTNPDLPLADNVVTAIATFITTAR